MDTGFSNDVLDLDEDLDEDLDKDLELKEDMPAGESLDGDPELSKILDMKKPWEDFEEEA